MSRYSKSCEQRFRNQFKQKFDFMNYNASLIKPFVGSRTAISFDPSHIEKSGKKHSILDRFGLVQTNVQNEDLKLLKSL